MQEVKRPIRRIVYFREISTGKLCKSQIGKGFYTSEEQAVRAEDYDPDKYTLATFYLGETQGGDPILEKNNRLCKALEYYAMGKHYSKSPIDPIPMIYDKGQIAKQAIEEYSND